ncbi:FHA domain-containing protein, partial [Pelomonas sp. KK5]|uniref:FHA domain-containing protein n=1 Tax=Pelomonas sp. KK5 TaxID=1855730 RepID=UPI0011808B47
MITLTVVSYNGQASDGRLSTQFDELGGTIGRADTNLLVLPDPDRTISRVHAQIVFRNGDFAIVDRGSNPIMVNGQALGSGREQRVVAGDRVQIGGYLLSVGQGSAGGAGTAARPADPFADLLGPAAAVQARSPAAGPALIDPLAAFGSSSGNTHGPQTTPGVYNKASARTPASAPPSMGGIPDDWDPFAPDPVAAPGPSSASPFGNSLGLDAGAGAAGPLIPGLGGGGPQESSLDNLFGLGPASGGDPLANSRLDAPMAKPNMAANADPLASLNAAPLDVGQARQDNSSLLNAPFQLPPAPRQAPAPMA